MSRNDEEKKTPREVTRNAQLFTSMLRIRRTEEHLSVLQVDNRLGGVAHLCIGQEAIAVAALDAIREQDAVFSSHRSHGHYLAYGGPVKELIAECMGLHGTSGGIGGSQHLHWDSFISHGVLGGLTAVATGAALARKLSGNGIAIVFLGDGSFGEGIVYEAFNFAALWHLPILFVVENNGYALSTLSHTVIAGDLAARTRAFGIKTDEIESSDVLELLSIFRARIRGIRNGDGPFCQIVHTHRICPFGNEVDSRNPDLISEMRSKDPIAIQARNITNEARHSAETTTAEEVKQASSLAHRLPFPKPRRPLLSMHINPKGHPIKVKSEKRSSYGKALNWALHSLLKKPMVHLLGQDLCEPFGGVFKTAKGLSSAYPQQVWNTPISEAGLLGLATGMARSGLRPIVEVQSGDYLALCADQLLNFASKIPLIGAFPEDLPLVVRVPMGGGRGGGPTQSQSIEKMFLGIPGLTVVAPTHVTHPGVLLERAVLKHHGPLLFLEGKRLYSRILALPVKGKCGSYVVSSDDRLFPTLHLRSNPERPAEVVCICYGAMLDVAMKVGKQLQLGRQFEMDIITPSLLSPLPIDNLIDYLGDQKKVIVLEEGCRSFGWGAEVVAQLTEKCPEKVFARVAAVDVPIPASVYGEKQVIPGDHALYTCVQEMMAQ